VRRNAPLRRDVCLSMAQEIQISESFCSIYQLNTNTARFLTTAPKLNLKPDHFRGSAFRPCGLFSLVVRRDDRYGKG
jgi:hypothetical protein